MSFRFLLLSQERHHVKVGFTGFPQIFSPQNAGFPEIFLCDFAGFPEIWSDLEL